MVVELYVANVAPNVSGEQVHEIFAEFGNVELAKVLVNQRTGELREAAQVKLEPEVPLEEIYERLNGYILEDRPLYVSLMEAPGRSEITPEIQEGANLIAAELGETEKQPIIQLQRLLQLTSLPFMELLVAEAKMVEEEGGMLTNDESRRRTLGGIFFYLARKRMSFRLHRVVFYNPQKKRQKSGDNSERKSQKAANNKKHPTESGSAPPAPSAPLVNEEALADARNELNSFYHDLELAQKQLDILKEQSPEDRSTGLFSATREVADLQKKIADILKQFPQLE
jgi:RNA recognition motif-containing protein